MDIARCDDGLVCGDTNVDVCGATFIADASDLNKNEIIGIGAGPHENILVGVK